MDCVHLCVFCKLLSLGFDATLLYQKLRMRMMGYGSLRQHWNSTSHCSQSNQPLNWQYLYLLVSEGKKQERLDEARTPNSLPCLCAWECVSTRLTKFGFTPSLTHSCRSLRIKVVGIKVLSSNQRTQNTDMYVCVYTGRHTRTHKHCHKPTLAWSLVPPPSMSIYLSIHLSVFLYICPHLSLAFSFTNHTWIFSFYPFIPGKQGVW